MTVTVYVREGCEKGINTHDALKAAGIEHELVNITTHPERVAEIAHLSYFHTPVVVVDDDFWSGFWPNKIDELAEAQAA